MRCFRAVFHRCPPVKPLGVLQLYLTMPIRSRTMMPECGGARTGRVACIVDPSLGFATLRLGKPRAKGNSERMSSTSHVGRLGTPSILSSDATNTRFVRYPKSLELKQIICHIVEPGCLYHGQLTEWNLRRGAVIETCSQPIILFSFLYGAMTVAPAVVLTLCMVSDSVCFPENR